MAAKCDQDITELIWGHIAGAGRKRWSRSFPGSYFLARQQGGDHLTAPCLRLVYGTPSTEKGFHDFYFRVFDEEGLRAFLAEDVGIDVEGSSEEVSVALAKCFAGALTGPYDIRLEADSVELGMTFSVGDERPVSVTGTVSMAKVEGGRVATSIFEDICAPTKDPEEFRPAKRKTH